MGQKSRAHKNVLEEVGAYRGWDGWVNHASYDLMKVKLEDCLAHFLDREAKDDSQRSEWIKAWLFAEHPMQISMRRYLPPTHALYYAV